MAQVSIDTSTIDNYENATVEELKAFIEGFQYDDGADEINRYKNSNSKANSKVAELTKQLREKMTDEERRKAEQEERYSALESKLNDLTEINKGLTETATISQLTSTFIGMGYTPDMASARANARVKGDSTAELEIEQKHIAMREQALKANLLKETPTPPAGSPTTSVDKEKFLKMSTEEQIQFKSENPDWLKILS